MELHYKGKNGTSEYEGYMHMFETYGTRYPRMDEGVPPVEVHWIWTLYFDKLRTAGMTLTEVVAYQELYGIVLETWEIDILFIIHSVVESTLASKQKEEYK